MFRFYASLISPMLFPIILLRSSKRILSGYSLGAPQNAEKLTLMVPGKILMMTFYISEDPWRKPVQRLVVLRMFWGRSCTTWVNSFIVINIIIILYLTLFFKYAVQASIFMHNNQRSPLELEDVNRKKVEILIFDLNI